MNTQFLIRISFAVVVVFVAWLYGAYQHKTVLPDSARAIQAPRVIALFFGKLGSDGILDLSGVVLQIFVCVMTPTFVLIGLGKVLPIYGLLIFVGITFLNLAIVLYHEYVRRREK